MSAMSDLDRPLNDRIRSQKKKKAPAAAGGQRQGGAIAKGGKQGQNGQGQRKKGTTQRQQPAQNGKGAGKQQQQQQRQPRQQVRSRFACSCTLSPPCLFHRQPRFPEGNSRFSPSVCRVEFEFQRGGCNGDAVAA